jgi:hypothetical protein
MRKDMLRIKASSVRVGQTLAFPNPLMDQEVWSILKDGKTVVFNEDHGGKVSSSAYVFIKSFDGIEVLPVESVSLGEFVKRDPSSTKVYKRVAYDQSAQRYQLDDCEDCSRAIYVKKGTPLFIGFTY